MRKRSRLVLAGSYGSLDHNKTQPDSKNPRPSEPYAGENPDASVPTTPLTYEDYPLLPLCTQQIEDSIFSTPSVSSQADPHNSKMDALVTQDKLSPIPIARRMLSRTSSRNLKENSSGTLRRGLASPFHSRPGSKLSSPVSTAKTKARHGLHIKARTLSSDLHQKIKPDLDIRPKQFMTLELDSILDSAYATSAPTTVVSATSHARTASIPGVKSSLLGNISPQTWLLPPKALSRSFVNLSDDIHLDTFQAQHPSFYVDAPAKVSTPPRKRSTTITQRSFTVGQQTQGDQQPASEMQKIVTMTDMDNDVPRLPRRRRRTVVHMSSDSIFSSALDFSAYSTEYTQTKKLCLPLPTRADSTPLPAGPKLAPLPTLDPAFSPVPSYISPEDVEGALDQTLKDLGTDYVDLFPMHWPV